MPFYVKSLDPQLSALGPQQQVIWGTHSTVDWQWINRTPATADAPTNMHVDWMNGNQKGYRFGHVTTTTGTPSGMFHLSEVTWTSNQENSVLTSTRIWTYKEDDWEGFHFYKPAKFDGGLKSALPVADDDVATKAYVDTHGVGMVIGTAHQIQMTTTADGKTQIGLADDVTLPGNALTVPVGTSSDRPTDPAVGMIRMGTDLP